MIFEFSNGHDVIATMRAETVQEAIEKYAAALGVSADSIRMAYDHDQLTVRVFDVPPVTTEAKDD